MEKNTQEAGNNLVSEKKEEEEKKEKSGSSQIPQRNLRKAKQVNYSQFFSDEADNSEEYETPEEIKQKIELTKKRKRPQSTKKEITENKTTKKKKIQNKTDNNNENINNNEEEKKEENNMEIDKEKNKKENNQEKEENNVDKKNKNNNFGTIINITNTLAQFNETSIPNSELILIILEICLNSSQYGLEKDNSSRAFWDEIGKKEEFKQLTNKFKTETLRKYWRTIRETKKYRKIITEIRKYKNDLNDPNMKLYSSIHAICEYVSNPGRKFDYYKNKHITKTTNKPKKINVNDLTPNQQIEDIVNTFKKYFQKDEKEIIEILFKNNFDIENAFLSLKDTENYLNLSFSEKDDEIIKKNNEDKDDKNEEYQNLINVKGLEEVLRRKEFLFNIKIDRSQYIAQEENEKNENEEKNIAEKEGDVGDKEKKMEVEEEKAEKKEENNNQKEDEKINNENKEKMEIKE